MRFADRRCTILIGEPGLGKSTALRQELARIQEIGDATLIVDLSSSADENRLHKRIFGTPEWERWLAGNHHLHLLLDSLDFALLRLETVVELLQNGLGDAPIERLTLRLACRTAERPRDLEAWLRRKFGPAAFEVLELLPLRRIDVIRAGEHVLTDASAFIDSVVSQQLQPLAMIPITLRMLLEIAAARGGLPDSRRELYELGCLTLADEFDEPRRRARERRASLSATQRLAVAERVAGLLLLSAHPTVTPAASGPAAEALLPSALAGGTEINRSLGTASEFEIDEHAINDTLRCGLFTNASDGLLHFAHQTYGEYLCGRWLATRFSPEQLDDLLFAETDDGLRVIPQLRAVAGWLASHSPAFAASLLLRDPAVLLRADPATTLEGERSLIVEALLRGVANYDLRRFDLPVRNALPHLAHPGLAQQLRTVLADNDSAIPARETAADLAAACCVVDVESDLLDLALDDAAPVQVRDAAVAALGGFAGEETRRRLVPLAVDPQIADTDDELKGIALSVVWPDVLSLAELLPAITPPKRRSLFGSYKQFLRTDFLAGISIEQLPMALAYAHAWPYSWSEAREALGDVRERLLVMASEHLGDDVITDAVARLILPVLDDHGHLTSRDGASEHEDFLADAPGRRALVERIVNLERFNLDGGVLTICSPPLIRPDDLDWIVDQLAVAVGGPRERTWAESAEALTAGRSSDIDERIYDARIRSPALRELTAARYDAVGLDSVEAASMRERYLKMQQMAETREARLQPPFDVQQKAAGAIGLWNAGDLNGYWSAMGWLEQVDQTHSGFATSDPRQLAGWQTVDEGVHRFLADNAVRYLNEAPSQSDAWFDRQTVDLAAWAAYRALRLLSEEHPSAFKLLADEVWVRWAAVIMGWPCNGEDERVFNAQLVAELTRRSPATAAIWLARALRREQRDEGSFASLSRVVSVSAPELDAVVLKKARDGRCTPSQRASALEHLLSQGSREAEALARRLVVPSAVRAGGRRLELAAQVAALLALERPDADWSRTWRLFKVAPDFGDQLVTKLASDREAAIGPRLTEGQNADLFAWLTERYPHSEDPSEEDIHWIGPREQIGRWRDGLVQGLVLRGTAESVQELDALHKRFPNLPWLKFMRVQAAEAARRAQWMPPSPARVLEMAEHNGRRWITSSEALQSAVIEALSVFQRRLIGLDPQAADLWDTASAQPKGEQDIGRVVSRFLKDHLGQRGVFLAREPEARPSKSGSGRGESIDIWIEALVGPQTTHTPHATVVIELKGSWNPDLLSAMSDQLVDRYLEPPAYRHGIYLVAWFASERWDQRADRSRYKLAGRHQRDALRDALAAQATELNELRTVAVDAIVLDCSLPPVKGATYEA